MSQQINDNFQRLFGAPIDNDYLKTTIGDRDVIPSTLRHVGLADLPADDTGVVATKAKAVVHGGMNLTGDRFQWCVVQIAGGIGVVVIDGWRGDLIANGQHGDTGFQAASAARSSSQNRPIGATCANTASAFFSQPALVFSPFVCFPLFSLAATFLLLLNPNLD